MFEATVSYGAQWKRLIDSVKDLVNDCNFQCTANGITMQAMDSAHIALVAVNLRPDGFDVFHCERPVVLGINLLSFGKILKAIGDRDRVTIRHEHGSDDFHITAESEGKRADYRLKLMDIEAEGMGVPQLQHMNSASFASGEFAKVCRDMSIFGDTLTVTVGPHGIAFKASNDLGSGETQLFKDNNNNNSHLTGDIIHQNKQHVKRERDEDDILLRDAFHSKQLDESPPSSSSAAAIKGVTLETTAELTLSFALKYFQTFSKAGALADRVSIHVAHDQPCMVEYLMDQLGFIRYYLAPKITDE